MATRTGWTSAKLEELAKTATGGTPSRSNRAYFAGTIPWVKSGELDDNVIYDTEEHISPDALRNSSAKVFPKGTVLVALYGATVGKTAILASHAASNQAVCAVFVDDRLLDPQYLRYFLMHIRPELLRQRCGGAQPNISQTIIRNTRVHYPSIREQQEIAAVLSALKRAIERQERLIVLSAELKNALMHKLFTEGTRGEPLKRAYLWPIPQSWPTLPLGECLALIRNGLTSAQNKAAAGIPVTRIETIADDLVNPERVGFTDAATAAEIDLYRLRDGDILMSHINSEPQIGRTAIYRGKPELLLHGMNLLMLRCNTTMLPAFLHRFCEYLRAQGVFRQLASRAVGQSSINQGKIKALLVPCPTLIEQQEICAPLETVEARRDVAEKLRDRWEQLFDRLLHDLMTSTVRVRDLDLSALGEASLTAGMA
jgi:type I restriction enzyme, S subunit